MFSITTKPFRANDALLFHCLVLIMLLARCNFAPPAGPASGNTPEQMFEALIQSPLPPNVTDLEGTGDTWQGHSIYLRFKAEPAFLEAYLRDGFEAVPCDAILPYFELPNSRYDVFNPSWKPEDVANGACYRSEGFVGEKWMGEQFILWDLETNTVYFYGVGG